MKNSDSELRLAAASDKDKVALQSLKFESVNSAGNPLSILSLQTNSADLNKQELYRSDNFTPCSGFFKRSFLEWTHLAA